MNVLHLAAFIGMSGTFLLCFIVTDITEWIEGKRK